MKIGRNELCPCGSGKKVPIKYLLNIQTQIQINNKELCQWHN
ncbi:hypothetical protein HNV12_09615 [Methanococcoides sp. SA1]|nr:hypothetical protein [Methanococcoides sp. SA1]